MDTLRRFGQDQRGSIIFLIAFAVFALGMTVGLAVDGARIYSVDKRVQAALDSAALAGAKFLNERPDEAAGMLKAAESAFKINTANISGGEAQLSSFAAVADGNGSAVTASVTMSVPTTFGRLAGMDRVAANKNSTASYNQIKLEVVLALDVTGSMLEVPAGDSVSKLAAMKSAATMLIDGLFDEAKSDTSVRIAVVPWSSGVKSGSYQAAVTGSSGGDGCVVERQGEGATSESFPTPLTYALPMPAAALAAGYVCPTDAVQPLRGRNVRSSVTNMISSLSASGGTAGHIGTAWGWYMISPSWASAHPSQSKPDPYSKDVVKAIIIMSDGIFNTSFVGGTLNSGSGGFNDESYAMFQQICDGMREKKIRVYTVSFDIANTTALAKMEACADSGNAMTAANASQLQTAFGSIMSELNSIKLTR